MAKIKISDLSVGDWIATESAQLTIEGNDIATAFVDKLKKPIQIVSVLGDEQLVFGRIEELDGFTTIYLKAEHIEPIPLTPEILEKNGFDAHGNEYYMYDDGKKHRVYISNRNKYWNFEHCEFGLGCVFHDMRCELLYTHQLQHALRLAGVEKEIEVWC